MIELPKDAPGEAACGYSGRPLLAICPCGKRRTVPFRLLKTDFGDQTAIYGRPFKCKVCDSTAVTLYVFNDWNEFARIRDELRPPPEPLRAHSSPSRDAPPDTWL